MEVYSIGFTKTSAADFFQKLRDAQIQRLIDVRLNNSSQLAAFAKQNDLKYFLKELCATEYIHEPLLAPTKEILDTYKKKKGSWDDYEQRFLDLMSERHIEDQLGKDIFGVPTILLCSEPTAQHCHRRLVLEYLRDKWGDIEIVHL